MNDQKKKKAKGENKIAVVWLGAELLRLGWVGIARAEFTMQGKFPFSPKERRERGDLNVFQPDNYTRFFLRS